MNTPGILKFASGSFQALENAGSARILVERSRGDDGAVTVGYRAIDGTATDGEDFSIVTGTLSWAAGDDSNKSFVVPLLDDSLVEGTEIVELELFGATGGAILDAARSDAVLTLVDDDSGGALCAADARTLCLQQGRFRIRVDWQTGDGARGDGNAIALSDESGLFWFFDRGNVEVLFKLLDACALSDTYWVFWTATTDLELELEVEDTITGLSRTYRNPLGQTAAPVQDLFTFSCN